MAYDPTASNLNSSMPSDGSGFLGRGMGAIAPMVTNDEAEDSISLLAILNMLRRRLWVLLGVSAISTAGFAALALSRPPSYSATVRILVEPVTTGSQITNSLTAGALQSLKPLAKELGGSESSLDYVSQIEVLRSQLILDPIAKRIQERYPKLNYEELIKRLKIIRPKESRLLDIMYESRDPSEIQFVLSQLSSDYIKYSVDDRQSNLKRGVEFVDVQIQRQQLEVMRLERLLEEFRRGNNLLDPKISAEALSERIRAISGEQQQNRIKLLANQALYDRLQSQVGLSPNAAIGVATLSEAPTYQNLLGKLKEIDSKIATESARFTEETPVVQALQDQRQELMPLLETEASRILGGNEAGLGLEPSQALGFQGSVGRDLTKELITAANQVQVLQTQDQAIAQAVGTLTQQTQTMAGVARQFGQIQRDLEIAIASLTRLLAARENLQLETTRQTSPWELVSRIDGNMIKPKGSKLLMLLLAGIGGLISGVVAALIAEQLDRVYHDTTELKELGIPCLGAIPYNPNLSKEAKMLSVGRMAEPMPAIMDAAWNKQQRRNSIFLEAFYSLDANIRLLSSDRPVRVITISSTSPSDGKSTVSSHLAWAAVTMGKKVLIIDTDLRRPQVHLWFGLQNMRGLSNAITQEDAEVRQFIQESPQDANLHVLTAGPTPPAPGRLLSSNKMRQFIDQLRQDYDFIICDAPPVLGFADAKLTAAHTDGLMLVVGLGKTDRSSLSQIMDELRSGSHAPVLGIIANGEKRSVTNSYHYYSRYYDETPGTEAKPMVLPKGNAKD
jgi:polysaccharide biosynthesis transport protein